MAELGTAYVPTRFQIEDGWQRRIDADVDRVSRGVTDRFTGAFRGIGTAMAGAFATVQVGQFFGDAISGATDLAETVSKANTIFGSAAPAIDEWARGAASSIGQSRQQALDAAATFGNLFSQLGIGADTTADMSTQMVNLASDFASFHNADITEVIMAQQAAFRGEFDAVQRFVPTINAAAVAQRALEMTGKATTAELTEQEKALATQALLMEGAGAAAGDFARTSDGLANRQRILGARFQNLKDKLGTVLLPVVTTVTGFLADKLVPAIETIGRAIGFLVDGDLDGFAAAIDGLLASFGLPSFEGQIRRIGEVILQVADFIGRNFKPILIGLGLAVAALVAPFALTAGAILAAYLKFEGFRNVVDAVVRWLVDTAAPAVADFVQIVADKFGELVGWVQEHWASIQEAIGHVVAAVQVVIETFVAFVQTIWQAWGDEILRIASTIWDQIRLVVETAINLVRGIIETVVALINGDWGEAWDAFKGVIDTVWTYIRETIENVLGIIAQVIEAALSSLRVIWDAAWGAIADTVSGIWSVITGAISSGIEGVTNFITGLLESIKDAVKSAADWVLRQVDRMLGPLDEVIGRIGDVVAGIGGAIGGAIGRIPGFAAGVSNFSGGWAVVGERGPELVNLPRGSDVIPAGSLDELHGGDRNVRVIFEGVDDGLMEVIRRRVRVEGGGDVQVTFGAAS